MSMFVPFATRKRLPLYYKLFKTLYENGTYNITSKDISKLMNIDSTTIRRDFSYVGKLGRKGSGYNVEQVIQIFEEEFELNKLEKAVVIGFGNLGQAVSAYFSNIDNFIKINQIYDVDNDLIGTMYDKIIIRDYKSIKQTLDPETSVAILTIPGKVAQKTFNKLVECGIKGFVNFSGTKIFCDLDDVVIYDIDIAQTMQSLVYDLREVK